MVTKRKRDRTFSFGTIHRKTDNRSSGGPWFTMKDERIPVTKVGVQETESEGHPFPSRKTGQMDDIGGEFFTTRQYVKPMSGSSNRFAQGQYGQYTQFYDGYSSQRGYYTDERVYKYSGPVLPVAPQSVSFPPTLESSRARLEQLGATAIARCKPTNSVADVSTFMGETLREGLPKLVGAQLWRERNKTLLRKRVGGEYLNVQFGWLPFVSEIKDISKAILHAETVLSQYERDAGKLVRRRFNFPKQVSTSESVVLQYQEPYGPGGDFVGTGLTGSVVRSRVKTQRQWFSGAFTYALPPQYDKRNAMQRSALGAKKLFGATLSPDVVWNLTPWSWAVDWFSNAGDVLSNISDWSSDGLVMRWGYLMEHTIVEDTYTLHPQRPLLAGLKMQPEITLVTETKRRIRANPFGFGVSWEGLSPTQLAIAAALGMSR